MGYGLWVMDGGLQIALNKKTPVLAGVVVLVFLGFMACCKCP